MATRIYEEFCGDGYIRLLVLRPFGSDRSSPIISTLKDVALSSEPQYEALSYAWGTGKELSPIRVNDHLTNVGPNLYTALQDLRLNNKDRTVWVDAICINQGDADEKLFQIKQMDLVYSNATQVISYLGRGPASPTSPNLQTLFSAGHPDAAEWARFITSNPYWTRLWIIQEIGLARYICVQIGRLTMTWEHLLARLSDILRLTYGTEFHEQCSREKLRIQNLASLRRDRYGARGTLENLIETFQEAACFNTVDKVYGLIGLANDYNNRIVKQGSAMYGSYNKSKSKLYVETMEHFWLQRLIVASSGFNLHYDRSMRIMRYSELLLNILEEGFVNDVIRQTPRSIQVVARAEIIGTISSTLQHCNTTCDIEEYFSSDKIPITTTDPFNQRLNRLTQTIQALTHETMSKVTRQITAVAQGNSIARYGTGNWQPSDFEWDRIDQDSSKLPRLDDIKSGSYVPFLTTGNGGRIFQSANGLFGFGSIGVKEGDVICQFWEMESRLCVLLRRDEKLKGGFFRVVGRVLMLEDDIDGSYDSEKSKCMVLKMGADMLRFVSS